MTEPAQWNPLVDNKNLKPMPKMAEDFDNSASTNGVSGSKIITILFIIVIFILLMVFFYWMFNRNPTLLIALISSIIVLYAIEQIIMITTVKAELKPGVYNFYLGSAIFVLVTFFTTAVYAFYRYYTQTQTLDHYTTSKVKVDRKSFYEPVKAPVYKRDVEQAETPFEPIRPQTPPARERERVSLLRE